AVVARNWHRPAFESEPARPRKRSRIWEKRNASQLARAASAVSGKRFICIGIELTRAGVALDRGVELLSVECLEPRTKPRQFLRSKLHYGFLDVFGGGHAGRYSICA